VTDVLTIVLQVLLALTSIVLVLLVLLHKGRGGGLSDMFGGGASSAMGGQSIAEKNLDRITISVALVWVVVIVLLNLLTRFDI
jgi:preprotein translocase subunit SecG